MCLSASDADKIVAGCKAEAAKNKWNVSIAVVDDGGFWFTWNGSMAPSVRAP